MDPVDIYVISHTHWDREWYHPAGRFRQRLVELIDELLDEPTLSPPTFLLDGQAVVLEDYAAVRPERASELARALGDGRLEAGPWYVLADELLPSGEALVRNLLAGRRALRAMRALPPPVLYCPDSFGHPAMLPSIAAGFGLAVAVVWRGYGGPRWPAGDVVRWRASDGMEVLMYHLPPSGYEAGSSLPPDRQRARERWRTLEPAIAERSSIALALLPNGADHHAPQPDQAAAMEALADAARPHRVMRGSLRDFGRALVERAAEATLPVIEGELRDSYGYCWTLQGTLATRARQKRENAAVERLLVRESEPWAALALRGGARSRRSSLAAAWRTLLLCQPHDTLCGTSTDEVARAMDARLADARAQAAGIRDDALLALVRHDPVEARERTGEWSNILLVRNPAARVRGGVAEVELLRALRQVPVGPGSAPVEPSLPLPSLPPVTLDDGAIPLQPVALGRRHDRVESPRHYPRNDLVEVTRALAWLPPVTGYGVRGFRVGVEGGAMTLRVPNPVRFEEGCLTNGLLRLESLASGGAALASIDGAWRIGELIALEVVRDAGDSYTHGPVGDVLRHPPRATRIIERGPLRGTLELRWGVRPPPWPDHGRAASGRTPDRGRVAVRVRLSLLADSPLLRIAVLGDNRASDHRVRLLVATGVERPEVYADAAFGPVRREPLRVSPAEARIELPPATAPLHRYVTMARDDRGATLFGDGLAEYEALSDGTIAVTLVRAIGELSRNDIPERPGHAGWPVPTPRAQMQGRFGARHGLLLHGARDAATVSAIERAAEDLLLPLAGSPLRSALERPPPVSGFELAGEGLAFSCAKESEDGRWLVLRCVNLLDVPVQGAWTLGGAPDEVLRARLDETPGESLSPSGSTVAFTAAPREIVTLLVR